MVGDSQHKGPEKIAPEATPENKQNSESSNLEQDLTTDTGINAGEILDDIDEGGEMVDSLKLSEKGEHVGEHRKATGKKFGDFKKQMTKQEAEALKKKLLEEPPSSKVMIREIRAHIHREIRQLEKDAAKAQRKGKFEELATSVARMRELKGMLYDLVHATVEFVRNLWLKVVHGIV